MVGFNCEWNYKPITKATGKVSSIQVACADSVWLFRVKPSEGVPRAIEHGTLGLSDISAVVLGGKLCKDSNLHLSDWESETLEENQVMYAALDAWASFKIFESVKDHDVFRKILPDHIPAGLHCSFQYIGSPVAFGHIAEQVIQDGQNNSEEIPFAVTRVGIPGALIITKEGKAKPLSEFGTPPFVIPVPISLLCTKNPNQCIPTLPSLISSANDTPVDQHNSEDREGNDDDIETTSISTASSSSDNDSNDIPITHQSVSTAGSQLLPTLMSEQQYT
ncbi:hypothetical protein INT45_014293 [Circinella minor]|uniref:Uncharacterized protein n=1 Tax=Circinella minor TaxID=1195481 RepID=A0A8H7RSK0_9FUNG|nr:hypothetical protein INT45_014293 [Circinella minor]